jgi:hypothetical protein
MSPYYSTLPSSRTHLFSCSQRYPVRSHGGYPPQGFAQYAAPNQAPAFHQNVNVAPGQGFGAQQGYPQHAQFLQAQQAPQYHPPHQAPPQYGQPTAPFGNRYY